MAYSRIIVAAALLFAGVSALDTVPVDLNSYIGRWYQMWVSFHLSKDRMRFSIADGFCSG